MVKESSCAVVAQEVPRRGLWKATPWNFLSKDWTQGLALPQKGELLQSRTGNFLQPKQTVTFWQAMWKKTTTTTTNNCLLLLCHKVALLLQLAQPLTSTQIRAASTSIIKELILYTRIQLSKKKKKGSHKSEFYLLLQLINRVSNCLHIWCPILLLNYVFHPFVKCIIHLTMQKNPNQDWCTYFPTSFFHHTFEPLVLLVSSIREPQKT